MQNIRMLVGSVPRLCEPLDDTTIWQYMDFTKLVSILERKELFFVRVDEVDDILPLHLLKSLGAVKLHKRF